MKTVVYQSYRTRDVPAWITACTESVRAWAASNSYEYRFIDDSLFDRVPAWFRKSVAGEICPMTDLARLVVARELLAEGFDRTVWVDADVLVFAPEHLHVDRTNSFSFCHEVWLAIGPNGEAKTVRRINNAISVFVKGNPHLEFFIDACLRLAQDEEREEKIFIGTVFLTELRRILRFAILLNVGMFNPPVMQEIAAGEEKHLPTYGRALLRPLACANLCASLVGKARAGAQAADDAVYEAVVKRCLETKGDVVNRFVQQGRPGTPAA